MSTIKSPSHRFFTEVHKMLETDEDTQNLILDYIDDIKETHITIIQSEYRTIVSLREALRASGTPFGYYLVWNFVKKEEFSNSTYKIIDSFLKNENMSKKIKHGPLKGWSLKSYATSVIMSTVDDYHPVMLLRMYIQKRFTIWDPKTWF